MGTRGISTLYSKTLRKTYQEVDELVSVYQHAKDNQERQEALDEILCSFHSYFMKYVRLIQGNLSHHGECLGSSDTMEFLSLFAPLTSRAKPRWHLDIYNFISRVCSELEEGDIYNELCKRFIILLNNYKVYEGTSFARYITKHLRWSMKAWITDIARHERNSTLDQEIEDVYYTTSDNETDFDTAIDLPEIDLQWIVDPKSSLFSGISQYERFLLYLSFKEGLGVRQIGERLGRTKDTIHRHISRALYRLREQYRKETENAFWTKTF